MRKLRCQYFNIVEIALALAIVGIGIAGIMSLFPVALNASRDSVGDNNAPDVAEQFLSYSEAMAYADTTSWDTAGFVFNLPDYASIATSDDFTPSGAAVAGNIYQGTTGKFKVMQKTGDIVDFSAIVRIWKAQITNLNLEKDTSIIGTSIPYKFGAVIYVEISWPAEKPYSAREKRLYYLELFNYNITY